jgi:hypothetical protein
VTAEEEPSSGEAVPWPSAVRAREWVDPDGTRWRRRGGPADVRRAERLLRSADVRVLHFYGPGAPTEIAPGDREALWARVRPYVRDRFIRVPGDFADFEVAEFKDDDRRSLLVIEESC